jgi:hypothetical protein
MIIATFNINGVNGRLPILLRWLEESQEGLMIIATFNINGVNGRLPILLRWLEESQPDVDGSSARGSGIATVRRREVLCAPPSRFMTLNHGGESSLLSTRYCPQSQIRSLTT